MAFHHTIPLVEKTVQKVPRKSMRMVLETLIELAEVSQASCLL